MYLDMDIFFDIFFYLGTDPAVHSLYLTPSWNILQNNKSKYQWIVANTQAWQDKMAIWNRLMSERVGEYEEVKVIGWPCCE